MPTTRLVMTSSALVLAAAGFACLFAPAELMEAGGFPAAATLPVQLLGALYLGLAASNWTARGSMVGGIYARPLALANFMHWVIGVSVLIRQVATSGLQLPLAVVTFAYFLFAVLFALVLYGRLPSAEVSADG